MEQLKDIDIPDLNLLSGETTIAVSILRDDIEVMRLIRQGKTYNEVLEYINENY